MDAASAPARHRIETQGRRDIDDSICGWLLIEEAQDRQAETPELIDIGEVPRILEDRQLRIRNQALHRLGRRQGGRLKEDVCCLSLSRWCS